MILYIICIFVLTVSLILASLIFKPNIKKLKFLKEDEELENIANKFPEDIQIAEEILDIIEKDDANFARPKVESAENSKASLYIVITNKMLIANLKSDYARIQTIAHECIHSTQNKQVLIFNFIISNINIIFFIALLALTLFRVIEINMVLLFVFVFMIFMQLALRSYLEVDAMKRARRTNRRIYGY